MPKIRFLVSAFCIFFFSGCNFSDDSAQSAARAAATEDMLSWFAPKPVDWSAVQEAEPGTVQGLSLWLSAEALTLFKDGASVKEWKDLSGSGLLFTPSGGDAPSYRKKIGHEPASVHFSKPLHLASTRIPAAQLASQDGVTVFVVLKAQSPTVTQDIFGWGGCDQHRLIMHLLPGGTPMFQLDNSVTGSIAGNGRIVGLGFHILSFNLHGEDAEVFYDGASIGLKTAILSAGIGDTPSKLMIGNSTCGNGLNGDLAEILIYRNALSSRQMNSLTLHFSKRYGIALQGFTSTQR